MNAPRTDKLGNQTMTINDITPPYPVLQEWERLCRELEERAEAAEQALANANAQMVRNAEIHSDNLLRTVNAEQALALRGEPVARCSSDDVERTHHVCKFCSASISATPISGERVREALQMLHDDTKSYIEVNNLGDPWHNQSMKLARDALALPLAAQPTGEKK